MKERAECGLKVGDTFPPDSTDPKRHCTAIRTVPASGLKYLHEMGRPPGEHTQVIDIIYDAQCERNIEGERGGYCPALHE